MMSRECIKVRVAISHAKTKLTSPPQYLQYGGCLENRARFILQIAHAIKARLPSDRFVIAVKFNCHDCECLLVDQREIDHRLCTLLDTFVEQMLTDTVRLQSSPTASLLPNNVSWPNGSKTPGWIFSTFPAAPTHRRPGGETS